VIAVSHFPSLIEIGVGLGIIAYALLGFTLGVRYLEIYPKPQNLPDHAHTE
jgi:Ni/Fe-hydrogenase subunit HybB-like protein